MQHKYRYRGKKNIIRSLRHEFGYVSVCNLVFWGYLRRRRLFHSKGETYHTDTTVRTRKMLESFFNLSVSSYAQNRFARMYIEFADSPSRLDIDSLRLAYPNLESVVVLSTGLYRHVQNQ